MRWPHTRLTPVPDTGCGATLAQRINELLTFGRRAMPCGFLPPAGRCAVALVLESVDIMKRGLHCQERNRCATACRPRPARVPLSRRVDFRQFPFRSLFELLSIDRKLLVDLHSGLCRAPEGTTADGHYCQIAGWACLVAGEAGGNGPAVERFGALHGKDASGCDIHQHRRKLFRWAPAAAG